MFASMRQAQAPPVSTSGITAGGPNTCGSMNPERTLTSCSGEYDENAAHYCALLEMKPNRENHRREGEPTSPFPNHQTAARDHATSACSRDAAALSRSDRVKVRVPFNLARYSRRYPQETSRYSLFCPTILLLTLLTALGLVPSPARAADEPPIKALVLPKSPRAAAYVLGRLSNKELVEAPRSEFVYVALLERKGIDRRYRFEALEGLAKLRNSNPV